MSEYFDDSTAKWLVGERLAHVLVLDQTDLAAQLAEQGHDVIVSTTAPPATKHADITYVLADEGRFPFIDRSFTSVVTTQTLTPTLLASISRVLDTKGWLGTWSEGFDESLPWLKKLRDIVGGEPSIEPSTQTLNASGLFQPARKEQFAAWEQLDLDGLMHLSRHRLGAAPNDDQLAAAHELFEEYGAKHQPLRLRSHVWGIRAQVNKEPAAEPAQPSEATLFEFN